MGPFAAALMLSAALLPTAQDQPYAQPTLPPATSVLAAPAPGFPLPACSRAVAGPVEGGWDPDDIDILAMESALSTALHSLNGKPGYDTAGTAPDPLDYAPGDIRWQREYFGIVRDGRRIIYGNFLPGTLNAGERLPTIVCDGGPVFFGAEYDMASGRIVHLAFNGAPGGPFWPVFER